MILAGDSKGQGLVVSKADEYGRNEPLLFSLTFPQSSASSRYLSTSRSFSLSSALRASIIRSLATNSSKSFFGTVWLAIKDQTKKQGEPERKTYSFSQFSTLDWSQRKGVFFLRFGLSSSLPILLQLQLFCPSMLYRFFFQ